MRTKLIFIRHGQTDRNIPQKLHVNGTIEHLTDLGVKQIKETAETVKDMGICEIVSSNRNRTRESSDFLTEKLNVPVKVIENLHERRWGIYEGKEWSIVKEILDKLSLEERYEFQPENGESWKQVETRLGKIIEDLKREYEGKTVAIVTHAGCVRAMVPMLLNAPKEESFKYSIENGSISIFEYENGELVHSDINNTDHLKAKGIESQRPK